MARLLQRSEEAFWNEEHRRLHPTASTPEEPAEPSVRREAEWIVLPSRQSKTTGWVTGMKLGNGLLDLQVVLEEVFSATHFEQWNSFLHQYSLEHPL